MDAYGGKIIISPKYPSKFWIWYADQIVTAIKE